MVGIKSIGTTTGQASKWTDDIADQIYDLLGSYAFKTYLHTVTVDKSVKSTLPDLKLSRYDIVLVAVENSEQINLNELVVTRKLAEFNPETKHLLQNIPNLVEELSDDGSENWDNDYEHVVPEPRALPSARIIQNSEEEQSDDNNNMFDEDKLCMYFTDEELMELYQAAKASHTKAKPIECQPTTTGENGNSNELEKDVSEDSTITEPIALTERGSSSTFIPADPNDRPVLQYIWKRPKVLWWQTEEMVVMRIQAHDNVEYGLDFSAKNLIYR